MLNVHRSPAAAILAFAIAAGLGTVAYAQSNLNTPGFIKKAQDLGPTDPTSVIAVTVWLQLHNEQQLDQLVTQQAQKGSANYHKWITQDQFNAAFGPTPQELNSVTNYLSAKNLTVLAVAENNMYVKVQGTVAQIQSAFGVHIHDYNLNGRTFRSNTADPANNGPQGAHIDSITGLDDYGFQPLYMSPVGPDGAPVEPRPLVSGANGLFFESDCFRGQQTQTFTKGATSATYSGNRFGSDITNNNLGHLPPCGYQPSELQAAYNLTPLYQAGFDGSGETIVIVDAYGSPTIQTDAEVFSQVYGLPDLTPDNFQVLRAPGAVNHPPTNKLSGAAAWAPEVTLDVEMAHAMAPGAQIVLVIGPNNGSDLDEAVNYAVVHHLGNTISNSWSGVEGLGNPAQFNRVNRILQMAAAQGIDVNFSSGDSGDFTGDFGFKTVGFPGSSPFATSVGGTTLALNVDHSIAFQTGWGNNLTRIADTVALGSPPQNPPLALGFQGGAGGGTSLTFAKPAFQSSLPGTMRLVPDISMLADPFTGVEIIETVNGQLSVSTIGGTSVACPLFSGIMALASQKHGHVGLGQASALLYGLPAGAITDVTAVSSPQNVIGSITTSSGTTSYSADQLAAPLGNTTSYYSALYNSPFSTRWFVITFGADTSLVTGPGWDNVTGLGTPNGLAFVNALAP
jgi:subtilase family serine protease